MIEFKLREAFAKIKSDIDYIFVELEKIKRTLIDLRSLPTNQQINPTNQQINPTNQQINPTNQQTNAIKTRFKGLKDPNSSFSTRNRGVPTNQQTNKPTNQQTERTPKEIQIDKIQNISEVISSLDALKKELRMMFKKLTQQEMAIFITLYQLEDQGLSVDYPLLAERCNLSEISIRDYVHKLTKKGINLIKTKQNNKKVFLSIAPQLKQMASLSTIINLREL